MAKFKSAWAEVGLIYGKEELRATAVILSELEKLGTSERRERVLRNVHAAAAEAQRLERMEPVAGNGNLDRLGYEAESSQLNLVSIPPEVQG